MLSYVVTFAIEVSVSTPCGSVWDLDLVVEADETRIENVVLSTFGLYHDPEKFKKL